MENVSLNNISCEFKKIPFEINLSFDVLLDIIRKISADSDNALQSFALEIINHVDSIDQNDISNEILKDQILLKKILVFVLNPINDQHELSAIFKPFSKKAIYKTQAVGEILESVDVDYDIEVEIEQDKILILNLYQAYLLILEKIYGLDFHMDIPFTIKAENKKTHLLQYYTAKMDTRYLKVIEKSGHKKLNSKELKGLFDKRNDLCYWNEKIPLEDFIFSGFIKINYSNNTLQHVISQLKTDLIDKNALLTNESFFKIRNRIRSLFENEKIEIGLIPLHNFENIDCDTLLWRSIIPFNELSKNDYETSFYQKVMEEKNIIMIDDFSSLKDDKVADSFRKKGIVSYAVVPLLMNEQVVGIMEFGSEQHEFINMLKIARLKEIYPMLALALQRSQEDWNDKIRAIIQKKYTAIHPTVEWKFRERVSQLLTQTNEEESISSKPIVFKNVTPIYGASDIQSSSMIRNAAISEDLIHQMTLISNILNNDYDTKDIPLVNNYNYKINKYIQTVQKGLNAGDELSIIDFLKKDIEPILHIIQERKLKSNNIINDYFNALDPELGILYDQRKNFEESLTFINDQITEIIEEEQRKAQKIYPHYFEKYRTDGVEYNIYIGESLVRDIPYNDIYLSNIRLWQFILKIKIARRIREIQPILKTKLEITQLILVHSAPLSIAFRQDEKKFDVDGAYNVRYEITKKRIDKATIKGTKERLTQVGKIAIVYANSDEIIEYKRNIEYLISQGYLEDSIEELELADLRGASGLKALRVQVKY